MNPTLQAIISPKEVVRILFVYKNRWLIPTVLLGALATAYAVWRPATWEASQALIVRNEAANNASGPGKFREVNEMKTAQETILELVKSQGVLAAALQEVGPPADYRQSDAAWPAPRDVAGVRENVKLAAPKGAEFGLTEVFYLRVQDRDRSRAVALTGAIWDRLQNRLRQLRNAKAQSMSDELGKTVQLAKADLAESTQRLTVFEKQVGSDLSELQALLESGFGDSTLGRTITEIRNELRQIRSTCNANQQLLDLLREAEEDPDRLIAMPNRLLVSQPALQRLKDGLVDAQLRTAALQGTMSDEHPLVQSAKESEQEVGRHLHNELTIAIRGLEVEVRLNSEREAMLDDQLARTTGRLDTLAGLHATYANQVAETKHRAVLVERAEQNLAEARAAHAGAKASSLISRIDAPDAGIDPVGPSRAMIVLIGLAGGLLAGFGVLFLSVQPSRPAADAARAPQNPETEAAAIPLPAETATPALPPGRNLSFKQALHKIGYGSSA